jgi:plastocyanin
VRLRVLALLGGVVAAGSALFAATSRPAPARHVIEIRELKFVPSVLEVHRGDTIVWINRDIFPHTATAEQLEAWNLGPLQQGDSIKLVAREPGETPYFCELHPVMKGVLRVE